MVTNILRDFHNHNQEGVHCLMQLFGPRGVPKSLRNVNGFGNHTFKFGRPDDGTFRYVKIHFKPVDGIENLTEEEAVQLAGTEPDYHIKDMYNDIEEGNFPKWRMFSPQEVGIMTLNRNASNYFAEIEQAAFSPSTMIPGIAPSADLMLHARMFSYPDAARYRIGPNYQQLPCNAAKNIYSPYQRDEPMRLDGNYGADPDYAAMQSAPPSVQAYSSDVEDIDWEQPRVLWKLFKKNGEDEVFIHNLSGHVNKALPEVQKDTIKMFAKVDEEIGKRLEEALDKLSENVNHKKVQPSQTALATHRR
ncbi:catalase-like domain-containing protein [Coniochaeta sp. 2T2.1]|nr:catalase-like domain-containing protein [Coniochaeta sp. 2T2.1]